MPNAQETTVEVVKVLDCLSAISADLNCKCDPPPQQMVLSAADLRDACAAIDEAVDSLRRLLAAAVAEGAGPAVPPASASSD